VELEVGTYFSAVLFDVCFSGGEGSVILDVDEDDAASAFFGEGYGDGVAETACTACDECYAWC
jgi:hypothetical protein